MNARFVCFLAFCGSLFAQQVAPPSLTIYNQDFAVDRQELPLDLKSGENQVNVSDITMHLEPDSVILRDPSGKHSLQVLEQNYRALLNVAIHAIDMGHDQRAATLLRECLDNARVSGHSVRQCFSIKRTRVIL